MLSKSIVIMILSLLVVSTKSYAQDTPHYDVVYEYIHELAETKNNQEIATSELAEEGDNINKMMGVIRNSTRIKLRLSADISRLSNMNLGKPFETLIPNVIELNKQKIVLYDELNSIAKTFATNTPEPNIDYQKLATRMPEISAYLEYIDESLFKTTPMFFMLLIDQKPDRNNHLSHLIITKKQGKELLNYLNSSFGSSLNAKHQNWTVSSASVLKSYLLEKGYKFSDDPW